MDSLRLGTAGSGQTTTRQQGAVTLSPARVPEKEQNAPPKSKPPPDGRKLKAGHAELWRAARTVLKSQRQAPPLQSVPRNQVLPLSFAQQRLWSLQQLQPSSAAYNQTFAYHIAGPLNIAALAQSLNLIVQRHEILRASFRAVEGQAVQSIAPPRNLRWREIDISALAPAEQQTQTQQLAVEESQRPFDLTQDVLLRATLLHLNENEHVLVLTLHQIAFDGPSQGVIVQELGSLYQALAAGKPSRLSALPFQYADFACWQRQWLQGEILEDHLAYWQEKLGSRVSLLQLPTDRRCHLALQTFQSAAQTFTLPPDLSRAIAVLGKQQGVTPFAILLTALQALLYHYTGQEDFLVFSSVAGRNRPEIKRLIGLFANLLALRADLGGNPTFRELLAQVSQGVLEAYSHQDLPFEQLVETLQPAQRSSHASLFQVSFVFQNLPMPAFKLAGLTVSPLDIDIHPIGFDLFLFMTHAKEGLTGWLRYKTDLFDAATIARMLEHFQILLAGIVADPEQRLLDLPCLTEAEQQQLLARRLAAQMSHLQADDLGIVALDPLKAESCQVPLAPRDEIEAQLVQIWELVFKTRPIGVRDNFFDLGGHSLLAARLFAKIEQTLGKTLILPALAEAPTIEQLANILRQEEWSPSTSSLVAIQSHGSRCPFFAVHPDNGRVLCYNALAQHLGPDQPFYGLQAQGLDGEQVPRIQVTDMATRYIKEIKTVQPEGPYLLGGMCVGNSVAFEMAQQLEAQEQRVVLLVWMGSAVPPGGPSPRPPRPYLSRFIQHLRSGRLLSVLWGHTISLIKELEIRVWRRKFEKSIADTPLLDVLYANRTAKESYKPQTYSGRVIIVLPQEGGVNPAKVRLDPKWARLVAGGVDCYAVPGSHHTMLAEPNVRVLAERLKLCLETVQANTY